MAIDPEAFQEAVTLFNQGDFFECHEVLEDLWRPLSPSCEKTFLQGLLQVGVGFHHWRNGNLTGAKNLLEAGCEKLNQVSKERYISPIQLDLFLEGVMPLLFSLRQTEFALPVAFPKVIPNP